MILVDARMKRLLAMMRTPILKKKMVIEARAQRIQPQLIGDHSKTAVAGCRSRKMSRLNEKILEYLCMIVCGKTEQPL